MLGICCLILLGIMIFVIYHNINIPFADFFNENKTVMLIVSCILASVITGTLYNLVKESYLLSTSSNVRDNFYQSSTEVKKHNISSKEFERVAKQLQDPEEREKLLATLDALAAAQEVKEGNSAKSQ